MTRAGTQGAGRFAPSPTGPLHLGSLLAAVASYLDAHSQGVAWQVRLDDLDEARNEPGAERAILEALERHGLHWQGPVVRQSEHLDRYRAALDTLAGRRLLFYCVCSRRELADAGRYPGTCRSHTQPRPDSALRIRVDGARIEFDDLLCGPQAVDLDDIGGDFVVRRRDGIVAYQLATAVDDGDPGITRVIRGRDLLPTTPRQIFLMRQLGLDVPVYGHIPLVINRAGQKLSKQTLAAPLNLSNPTTNLTRILPLLGIGGIPETSDCAVLLAWAADRFDLEAVPGTDSLDPAES